MECWDKSFPDLTSRIPTPSRPTTALIKGTSKTRDTYRHNQGYQQPTQTVYQPIEPVSHPKQQVSTNSFASEVLRLTNQERAWQGLAPLTHHSALATAAAGRSQEMLDPNATHLGVGFAELNGTVAVTQVFGNRL